MSQHKTKTNQAIRKALKKRATLAMDALDVTLEYVPISGRCMGKFRKLVYDPGDIIEIYDCEPCVVNGDPNGVSPEIDKVVSGDCWRDNYAYYHVLYDAFNGRFKLFRSLKGLCIWAEREVQAQEEALNAEGVIARIESIGLDLVNIDMAQHVEVKSGCVGPVR